MVRGCIKHQPVFWVWSGQMQSVDSRDLLPREIKHCVAFSSKGKTWHHWPETWRWLWFDHVLRPWPQRSSMVTLTSGKTGMAVVWVGIPIVDTQQLTIYNVDCFTRIKIAKWPGKLWKKMLSLVSCYSDFHMEQLRRWKWEAIYMYMFWPTGKTPRGYIVFRNAVLFTNQEITRCLLIQDQNHWDDGQHTEWEICKNRESLHVTLRLNKHLVHLSQVLPMAWNYLTSCSFKRAARSPIACTLENSLSVERA